MHDSLIIAILAAIRYLESRPYDLVAKSHAARLRDEMSRAGIAANGKVYGVIAGWIDDAANGA